MNISILTNMKYKWIILVGLMFLGYPNTFGQSSDVNSSTPNLGFEKGTYEGWTRYYGYYGPTSFWPSTGDYWPAGSEPSYVISNTLEVENGTEARTPVENRDVWTVRDAQITGTVYGGFQIMSSASIDKNIACDNLKQVPDGSTYAVRIGSSEDAENRAIDATEENGGAYSWCKRAMAEKMSYTFTVDKKSTLLTYKYAVLSHDPDFNSNHNNEKPPFAIYILHKKPNGDTETLCNSSIVNSTNGLTKANTHTISGYSTYCKVCEETLPESAGFDTHTAGCAETDDLTECPECKASANKHDFQCIRSINKDVEITYYVTIIDETKQKWSTYETYTSNGRTNYRQYYYSTSQKKYYYNNGNTRVYYNQPLRTDDFGNSEFEKQPNQSYYYHYIGTETVTTKSHEEPRTRIENRDICVECTYGTNKKNTLIYEDLENTNPSLAHTCYVCNSSGDIIRTCLDEGTIAVQSNSYCQQAYLPAEYLEKTYFKDWTTISYDLRDYIGDEITIEIVNHDCLEKIWVCQGCAKYYSSITPTTIKTNDGVYFEAHCPDSKCNKTRKFRPRYAAGYHRTYGYFTAETKPFEVIIKNCDNGAPIELTAPEGFSYYQWTPQISGTATSNEATIFKTEIEANKEYTVTMHNNDNDPNLINSGSTCTQTEDKFTLTKDPFTLDFDAEVACYNEVLLTNKSTITPIMHNGELEEPDSIINVIWTYWKNNVQNEANKVQIQGDSTSIILPCQIGVTCTYDIVMTLITKNDCRKEVRKTIHVTGRPNVEIQGDNTVCFGSSKELKLVTPAYLGSTNGGAYTNNYGNAFEYYWKDEKGNTLNNIFTGENAVSYMASPTNGTATYTLQIKSIENKDLDGHTISDRTCIYEGDHNITVKERPTITLAAEGMKFTTDNHGNTIRYVEVCEGDSIKLSATSNMDCDFKWHNENKELLRETNSNYHLPSDNYTTPEITDSTLFYSTCTTVDECFDMDSVYIYKKESPDLTINGPHDVCAGSDYTFTAGGAEDETSYVWTLDNNTNFQNKNLTLLFNEYQTEYHLELLGTNNNGCSSKKKDIIQVHNVPNIQLDNSSSTTVCEGEPITLTIVTGEVDSCSVWTGGVNPHYLNDLKLTMVDTPNVTTKVYYVEGFKKHGDVLCSSQKEIDITVQNAPKITIIDHGYRAGHICKNEEVYLSVSGASSYKWSTTRDFSTVISNTEEMKHTPGENISTITYYVRGYAGSNFTGCSKLDSMVITIHDLPSFTATADKGLVCENETDILRTHDVYESDDERKIREYIWNDGTKNSVYEVTVGSTTTYSVTGTDAYNCSHTTTVTVETREHPTITIGGDENICENGTAHLTASGAGTNGTYIWTFDNETIGTGNEISHSPSGTGIAYYNVEEKSVSCKNSDRKGILIKPAPGLTITGHEAGLCLDSSLTLTASGAGTNKDYTWYLITSADTTEIQGTGTNKNSITVRPGDAGTYQYQVEAADNDGCIGKTTALLSVFENPNVIITPEKTAYCVNEVAKVTAQGGNTYSWTLYDQNKTNSIGDATGPEVILPLAQTTYFEVIAQDVHGCKSNPQHTIITAKPYPVIKNASTNKDYVCTGLDVELAVENNTNYTYLWKTDYQNSSTHTFPTSTTHEFKDSGINFDTENITNYNVRLTVTQDGCSIDTLYSLSVSTPPNIYIVGPNSICEGTPMQLIAKGGTSSNYVWSNNATTDTITFTANSNIKKFAVTGKNAKGCVGTSDSFSVTVNSHPDVRIKLPTKDSSVCIGSTVIIEATGASSYTWTYTTEDQVKKDYVCTNCSSINPQINESATYIVTGTDVNSCSDTAQIKVTALEKPTIEVSAAPDIVCKDSTTLISARNTNNDVNVTSWRWTTGATTASFTTQPISGTSKFEVTAETQEKCTAQNSITVNVYSTEAIGIDVGKGFVCEGDSIIVNAIGGTSNYQWTRDDNSSWKQTGSSVSIKNVTRDINIFLTAKGDNGCPTEQATQPIQFISKPEVTISPEENKTYCNGDAERLTASGDGAMSSNGWSWYIDNVLQDNNTDNIQITNMTGEHIYSVKGTNTNGCISDLKSKTLKAADEPNLSVSGKNMACRGEKITITATTTETGATIVWDGRVQQTGTGSFTLDTTLSIAKTYNIPIELTNADGCKTKKTFTIEVKDIPSVTITNPDGRSSICEGDSINLIAVSSNTVTYYWNDSETSSDKNYTLKPEQNVSSASASVRAVDNTTQCSATASYRVNVNAKPTLTINNQENGSDKVCEGFSYLMTADGADNKDYQWSVGNSVVGGGISYQPTISDTTVYTVKGSNANGCYGETNFTVETKPIPSFSVPTNIETCSGTNAEISITDGTAETYTITWATGNTTLVNGNTTYTTEGLTESRTYTITGSLDGCSSEPKTATVTVNALPKILIDSDPLSKEICIGDSAKLTASGAGGNGTYIWTTTDGLTVDNTDNSKAVAKPTSVGEKTYKVTGFNGTCSGKDSIKLTVHGLPTVTIAQTPLGKVCEGTSTELSASGATSYIWNDGTSERTGNVINPIISKETTFTVTGTDANGCKNTAGPLTIGINDRPKPKWDNVVVCKGDNATIKLDKGTVISKINWAFDGLTTTGNSRTFENVTEEKTFNIKVYNSDGCEMDTFVTINVNDKPVISFTGDNKSCSGDEFSLDVTATNCTFEWSSQNSTTWQVNNDKSHLTDILDAGNNDSKLIRYEVTATNTTTSCYSKGSFDVTVHKKPTVKIADHAKNVCEGNSVSLTSKDAFASYSWVAANNREFVLGTTRSMDFTPTEEETRYILTATDDHNCKGADSTDIYLIHKPSFTFNYTPVCQGSKGTISLNNVSSSIKYYWTYNGASAVLNTNNFIEMTLNQDEEITVTAQPEALPTCETTEKFTAIVKLKPVFSILTNKDKNEICSNESIEMYSSNDAYNYTWRLGNSVTPISTEKSILRTIEVDNETSQTYTAIASDGSCSDSSKITILIHPKATFDIRQAGAACDNKEVELICEGGTATQFIWLDENKENTGISGSSNKFTLTEEQQSIKLYVRGENNDGCPDTIFKEITKVKGPKIEVKNNNPLCSGDIPTGIIISGAEQVEWHDGETSYSGYTIPSTIGPLTSDKRLRIVAKNNGDDQCETDTTIEI